MGLNELREIREKESYEISPFTGKWNFHFEGEQNSVSFLLSYLNCVKIIGPIFLSIVSCSVN